MEASEICGSDLEKATPVLSLHMKGLLAVRALNETPSIEVLCERRGIDAVTLIGHTPGVAWAAL